MRDDIIERQGQRIEVMLLGARSRATNSGGFRVLPAGAAAAWCGVVGCKWGEGGRGDGGPVVRGDGAGGERERGQEGEGYGGGWCCLTVCCRRGGADSLAGGDGATRNPGR